MGKKSQVGRVQPHKAKEIEKKLGGPTVLYRKRRPFGAALVRVPESVYLVRLASYLAACPVRASFPRTVESQNIGWLHGEGRLQPPRAGQPPGRKHSARQIFRACLQRTEHL